MKGKKCDPLWAWIADKKIHPETGGAPGWNFQKFLVSHTGEVLARFDPPEDPMGKKVRAALEKALAKAVEERDEWTPERAKKALRAFRGPEKGERAAGEAKDAPPAEAKAPPPDGKGTEAKDTKRD